MSILDKIPKFPDSAIDPHLRERYEDLRGFTGAISVFAVFLFASLWFWEWHVDPVRAGNILPLQLAMGAAMFVYPAALLAGLRLRVLPILFYLLLAAAQGFFLFILARLNGGLAHGGGALVIWFVLAPLVSFVFSWRANLAGYLLLLAVPNLLAGAFGSGFDQAKFNLLAIPVSAIALFVLFLTGRLLRRNYDLRQQIEWRAAAIDSALESVHVTDRDGNIEYVNPAFTRITGYAPGEVIGKKPSLLKSGLQENEFYEALWETILSGEVWRGEIVNRRKDDNQVTVSMSITPVEGRDGRPRKFIAISSDITEKLRMEEALALGHAEMEAVFNNAGVGIALLDLWGRFIKVNDFWLSMLGYTRESASGLGNKDITLDADVAETQQLFVALASGEIPHYENDKQFVCNGGRVFWGHLSMTPVQDESGYIRAIIAIVQDINERKLLEEKLEAMAHYDALTGLPNRALFFDRLTQGLSQSRRSQGQFALMFVDLDGFKAVNDTFGHDTGDAVLKAVSEHFLASVRESDTVARMGGDEFTLILRNLHGPQDAAAVAEKILTALKPPLHLLGHECRIGASIGIVLYPQHGKTAEELLNQADNAMYAVKKAGKNAYRFAEDGKEA